METVEEEGFSSEGADLALTEGLASLSQAQSLVLEGIYGDIDFWQSQLVNVLSHSHGLKHLGLSLDENTLSRIWWDDQNEGVSSSFVEYFTVSASGACHVCFRHRSSPDVDGSNRHCFCSCLQQ
jgi:hypothetical protein